MAEHVPEATPQCPELKSLPVGDPHVRQSQASLRTAKPPAAVWAACSSTESASNAVCSSLICVLASAISAVVKHGVRQSSCVHVAPIVTALRDASVMPEPIM